MHDIQQLTELEQSHALYTVKYSDYVQQASCNALKRFIQYSNDCGDQFFIALYSMIKLSVC
jgi:hypothetical protein